MPVRKLSLHSSFENILRNYGKLLQSVDEWFARSMASAGEAVQCGKGCSSCCRGLFDITLLDAYFLRQGFDRLSEPVKGLVLSRVRKQLNTLRSAWPEMAHPYILNTLSDEQSEQLMPEEDLTPCCLLGENGACLVYENRPMTCRLHGIPLVDVSGEIFQDVWCTRNFKDDDPLEMHDLRWSFRKCFQNELLIFREFTGGLLNQEINELDTCIPMAVLIDFDDFDWQRWWAENSLRIRNAGFPKSQLLSP